jgi:hypothetical protein
LAYYATPGSLTDPGQYRPLLDALPRDLAALCQAVGGLVLHYRSAAAATLPAGRLDEVRTRHVAAMLALLAARGGPLTTPRPPAQRLVGCCRDTAVLLCAALRHQGRPARVRVGFADYLGPDLGVDHWLTEVWDAAPARWRWVDAEQAARAGDSNRPAIDPLDVPRDRFLLAGAVWRACRAGAAAPARFGYDPATTGLGVVRANLLHDLACLHKVELTPWDFWGLGLGPVAALSPAALALLDRVAALTTAVDDHLATLHTLYRADDRLRVPPIVTTYTLADAPVATALSALGAEARQQP